jgi:hypothetical protein
MDQLRVSENCMDLLRVIFAWTVWKLVTENCKDQLELMRIVWFTWELVTENCMDQFILAPINAPPSSAVVRHA